MNKQKEKKVNKQLFLLMAGDAEYISMLFEISSAYLTTGVGKNEFRNELDLAHAGLLRFLTLLRYLKM